ncbi:uncharacterized protein LOC134410868 [Elgaria multicarinata webbii]|uniref:uncharacterized protein LOC134410868 n=1 Tax=Elgaria multicarinata webbii TaxID=159646 RepID=UPI002FCCEABF
MEHSLNINEGPSGAAETPQPSADPARSSREQPVRSPLSEHDGPPSTARPGLISCRLSRDRLLHPDGEERDPRLPLPPASSAPAPLQLLVAAAKSWPGSKPPARASWLLPSRARAARAPPPPPEPFVPPFLPLAFAAAAAAASSSSPGTGSLRALAHSAVEARGFSGRVRHSFPLSPSVDGGAHPPQYLRRSG